MDISELSQGVVRGDRRCLARAITMVESSRADHRAAALALLDTLPGDRQALRLGLSGTPGVGKSTFIESFGLSLVEAGLRVAVLAVDPSSARSGGSILGDKTRMERLARARGAFIRPSPSQTHLGGVARRTREAVALCEAAGFDVVIIETVGVGQSETMVAEMCDLFLLLLAPAGGDELQGVKRGIMETADLILVNKADGDLRTQAARTCADYAGALRLLRKRPQDPEGFPKALTVSAATGDGIAQAWEQMQTLAGWRRDHGVWDRLRADQKGYWFKAELRAAVVANGPRGADLLEQEVRAGRLSIANAVDAALGRNGVREVLTYRLRPGHADGFAQAMTDDSLPLHARFGIDVRHAGRSALDPDLYLLERWFPSRAEMDAALERLHASAEWREGLRDVVATATGQIHRVVLEG